MALDDEGYVVAQATTNEKGEFDKWQRTVPLALETNLVVPHPQETKPELFDLTNPDAPIPQFVNAMEMAGIEVELQEVADNLQYQAFIGADGKQYVIGYIDFDPNTESEIEQANAWLSKQGLLSAPVAYKSAGTSAFLPDPSLVEQAIFCHRP